jgi:arginine-tRNA-protein transferase
MESLFRYVAAPSCCGYLPDQLWSLEYEYVSRMTPGEYLERMLAGWRRFGTMLFRPACRACTACQALRVRVGSFHPDRSQRRCRRANEGAVELRIGRPAVSRAKLSLYDRYHARQAETKGWPQHPPKDRASYVDSFVHQPFPVEEWCYYVEDRLVGVGYVDCLPGRADGGLSAIYFYYDPDLRPRSLGTWNILCLIDEAARRGLPHVYLGYYVEGCPSMSYKLRFLPNQVRGTDGLWRDFRTAPDAGG